MENLGDLFKIINRSELARQLGLTRATLYNWKRVPAERVVEVEKITGISRTKLRPDLYEGMK